MSTTANSLPHTATTDNESPAPSGFSNWKNLFKAMVGIAVVYSISRVYLHEYAYSVGLDYFEPEFAVYWMPVLYLELAVASLTLFGVTAWLWKTRDTNVHAITPEEELRRYFRLITWLTAYTFVVLITGSVGGEADAAWHQVVIRDTDFTPTHIILFYLLVPALIIAGVGSFLYASTRLPEFSRRFQVPLCVAIGGPILIMPNVGLNEWGHTFFYAEELFAAPIHWGFAALGLALLGLGGVVMHLIGRMRELVDRVTATS